MTSSSTSSTARDVPTEGSALSRTLKLEDYDEITFDPTRGRRDDNKSSDDEDLNAVNRVRRGSENDDEMESTTVAVESSGAASEGAESSGNQVSAMLQLPLTNPPQQFHGDKFPTHFYQPSANPQAQFVSITTAVPPMLKNYYDFYPSQPDFFYHRNYYYNLQPMCGTAVQQQQFKPATFVPMAYNFVRSF